jgi:hypothetical protein
MSAPPLTHESRWTAEHERALQRRQKRNVAAVRFSSVLSAVATVIAAALAVLGLHQSAREVAAGPVDPLALTGGSVAYENPAIESVAESGLALIRYPWRSELEGWTISFLEPRGRASGYTWSSDKRIEIFVKDTDDGARVARVLAHELGHAVDVTLNTGDERRAWLEEREAPKGTPWWPGSGLPDFESGAGDFAEVFAAWQVGSADFKSTVNPAIDGGDYDLLAGLSLRGSGG